VSETFHTYVKARKKEGETMGEALVRLTGGPEPEAVASLVSEETAEAMEEAIDTVGCKSVKNFATPGSRIS
jgi:hypothetical protein